MSFSGVFDHTVTKLRYREYRRLRKTTTFSHAHISAIIDLTRPIAKGLQFDIVTRKFKEPHLIWMPPIDDSYSTRGS